MEIKVTAKIVELFLDSLTQEAPKNDIRKNVELYLDEKNSFTQVILMLLVNAIRREAGERFIGDSQWKLVGIENIEIAIGGRIDAKDDIKLP